jgi:UDP-3-O-[3-hydroxymyristoyl] glucosamine N-acyltransferase
MSESMKKPSEKTIWTVAGLAEKLACLYRGDGSVKIRGVSSLEAAGPNELVFFSSEKFRQLLGKTRAAAAVVPTGESFDRIPVLFSPNPQLTFVRAAGLFEQEQEPDKGIHPTACVSPSARIGKNVSIGALTVIADLVEIGDDTIIHPLVSVYPRVTIGQKCRIHSHVSLRESVRVGNHVVLHNGVVIGSDGFGYIQDEKGKRVKIPQTGNVIVEDHVEIGANTTIDRATFGTTLIKRGTKIDNLVQIGHNVEIGEHGILMGQVGIAGSCRIGDHVILSGQVGVADHIDIGNHTVVAAKSGITKNVPEKSFIAGTPHQDIREWRKSWAAIPQLYDLIKEVRRLKKRLDSLENQKD